MSIQTGPNTTAASCPNQNSLNRLFFFASHGLATVIEEGSSDEILSECGVRYPLMSRQVPPQGMIPALAYQEFLWCGVQRAWDESNFVIPGTYRCATREASVFWLHLAHTDGVYVIDDTPFACLRKTFIETMFSEREAFTLAEESAFMSARAQTLVPLKEYANGYRAPIVLVHRKLRIAEVSLCRRM